MELECMKCKEIFELNTDGFEKEQTDQDKYSVQYSEYGSIVCPKCNNIIDISNYDYWIENINNTLISGSETLECTGAKKV